MFGDAIDFASATHSLAELNAMNDAALNYAHANFVEDPATMHTYCADSGIDPKTGKPKINPTTGQPVTPYPCAHADWRFTDKGKYCLTSSCINQ
jgi:hypothetical protein